MAEEPQGFQGAVGDVRPRDQQRVAYLNVSPLWSYDLVTSRPIGKSTEIGSGNFF